MLQEGRGFFFKHTLFCSWVQSVYTNLFKIVFTKDGILQHLAKYWFTPTKNFASDTQILPGMLKDED